MALMVQIESSEGQLLERGNHVDVQGSWTTLAPIGEEDVGWP